MISRQIRSVGIVVKPGHADANKTAAELSGWLAKRGIEQAGAPIVSDEIHGDNAPTLAADLIVVLGGDGTMISTSRLISDPETLVLGVNYGGLGYLTDYRIEELFPALETITVGQYDVDHRVMLDAEHWRGSQR